MITDLIRGYFTSSTERESGSWRRSASDTLNQSYLFEGDCREMGSLEHINNEVNLTSCAS
jgi:hypothetical protein